MYTVLLALSRIFYVYYLIFIRTIGEKYYRCNSRLVGYLELFKMIVSRVSNA